MKNQKIFFVILAIIIITGIFGYYIFVYKPSSASEAPLPSVNDNQVENQTSSEEVPDLIVKINDYPETSSQKPENDFELIEQLKEKVQKGELLWFKNPVEVAKKYGGKFGISSNAQYELREEGSEIGEYSGLFHSTVIATDESKSYKIDMISEPDGDQPSIWAINAVTEID